MIREHLRSNVVGYVALFCFAMSGTAVAVDGSDSHLPRPLTRRGEGT